VSRVALVPLLAVLGVLAGVTAISAQSRVERVSAADSPTAAEDPPARVVAAPASVAAPAASAPNAARRQRAASERSREAIRRRRNVYGTVRVRGQLALRSRPRGPVVSSLSAATEFGSAGVAAVAASKGPWLGLVTTARPNNTLGWVRRDDPAVGLRRVAYSLHADLSERRLVLHRRGRPVKRLSVAVGRPGSSTPTGRFAITDKLSGARFGSYYGCCILALSGTQPNLPPGWTGGNRLAIHGTNDPGSIGQPSSAGCLRAGDADLAVLMRRVPLGTPVFIRR
jgi:lipoprotein-anchoring transpeptidase ErfK/SrfK